MQTFYKFLLLVAFSFNAQAVTRIDINKGNMEPLPIAINNFKSDKGEDAVGTKISDIVSADLERSGLFKLINKQAFIEDIGGTVMPDFKSWRQVNANALLVGNVKVSGDKITVTYRLFDVYGEKQMSGKNYDASLDNIRRIAHMISDEVYHSLTGEKGYFDTRLVYVAESGPGTKRVKRLAIMDQDGANHKFLTDGRHLALTPRFSPKMQQILYMSFVDRVPKVYIRDIESGREKVLGRFDGMTFAPRFSPNGEKAIMSLAKNGLTDLYIMDLNNMGQYQLTRNQAINTSPSFSPDGRQIVFNSDRAGKPQLYLMNEDGSDQRRISFGEGSYGNPVWSPRGDLIAFSKILKGEFYIGVMKTDGSAERTLTKGYLVEGQTWSPNGRVLIFTRQEKAARGQTGRSKLYSIDLTGYNEREVTTPLDASDPAWSPSLS
jgi:TolB protein